MTCKALISVFYCSVFLYFTSVCCFDLVCKPISCTICVQCTFLSFFSRMHHISASFSCTSIHLIRSYTTTIVTNGVRIEYIFGCTDNIKVLWQYIVVLTCDGYCINKVFRYSQLISDCRTLCGNVCFRLYWVNFLLHV